uniref:C-type lectin domain-containing protein n=1 Tax=Chrysemys picta bellii TaxID=8478 RepID=A0A8C3FYV1_CHRPI
KERLPEQAQKQEGKQSSTELVSVSTMRKRTDQEGGWELFQASCYYFSNDIMTWDDSERNCTGMDSHLVVINTGAEQVTFTGSEGMNYCIGLIDKEKKGQWHWVDETPYNDTAAFWRPGEPNNDPSEYCAVMHVEGKQTKHGNRNWNDIACFKLYNRICETAALIF